MNNVEKLILKYRETRRKLKEAKKRVKMLEKLLRDKERAEKEKDYKLVQIYSAQRREKKK